MTASLAPPAALIHEQVRLALAEDIGSGDVSAELADDQPTLARLICREPAVLAGCAWFEACFLALDGNTRFDWHYADGDALPGENALLCTVQGRSRALLTAERCALNFLQTLSGTATVTRRHVDAVAGTRARILDTRKTLPGLRIAQKYAVRCGGGHNHRIGLFDAVMLKENHIMAAGSITAAMRAARARHAELPLIVEVESLEQLDEVLTEGSADRALLDNFDLAMMRDAVTRAAGRLPLEVSGGVQLAELKSIAGTGIDCISIGALTKHVQAVDFSLRFAPHAQGMPKREQ